jgi:hypothetical protein
MDIRAIGMVVYTYVVLEERFEDIWHWFQDVETWAGQPYAEFHFSSRAKKSRRIWKATSTNRADLYQRLRVEQPWLTLHFGWPTGLLRNYQTKGLFACAISYLQPRRGSERYRKPSYLALIVSPDILLRSTTGAPGLFQLGAQAWRTVGGVYGFVDVETGIPPQDHLSRNIDAFLSNLVPSDFYPELEKWHLLQSRLDRRVWKAFWGNFLSAEHLELLGGVREMRRSDPHYELKAEYRERAYQQGIERLRGCGCHEQWRELANGGVLLTLSPSPLDWFEPQAQERRARLQEALGHLAIGPWDLE